jgi:hypothetical protein
MYGTEQKEVEHVCPVGTPHKPEGAGSYYYRECEIWKANVTMKKDLDAPADGAKHLLRRQ